MAESKLTSRIPYLLRAMHEWIIDNNQTPYVVVNAQFAGVEVPDGYSQDDRIILNIGYSAVDNLNLSNTAVTFSARFGGVSEQVSLPANSILGIYAKESGEGMIFASESPADDEHDKADNRSDGKPSLHIVK